MWGPSQQGGSSTCIGRSLARPITNPLQPAPETQIAYPAASVNLQSHCTAPDICATLSWQQLVEPCAWLGCAAGWVQHHYIHTCAGRIAHSSSVKSGCQQWPHLIRELEVCKRSQGQGDGYVTKPVRTSRVACTCTSLQVATMQQTRKRWPSAAMQQQQQQHECMGLDSPARSCSRRAGTCASFVHHSEASRSPWSTQSHV